MKYKFIIKCKETGEEKSFSSKLAACYAIADILERNGVKGRSIQRKNRI